MITVIRLSEAFLCPDCSMIVNNPQRCVCGNELGLMSLQGVLNRVPAERRKNERKRA